MINAIQEWISYIMVPREELLGFPICPYAKQAVKNKTYTIVTATTKTIKDQLTEVDLEKNEVTIFIIEDYLDHTVEEMEMLTAECNKQNNNKDLVILDNDPRNPFTLNGVTTTFKEGYLLLTQSAKDLNKKHKELSKSTYYSVWTQEQLDQVVTWRNSLG